MFIVFNYKCSLCGHSEERFVKREEMDNQFCLKDHPQEVMTRLPAGTRTDFLYADTKLKK